MSKAFTRESDDDLDDVPVRPLGAELPPGVKNYMTPEGAARLRDELERVTRLERPAIVAGGDARALRDLDRRIAFLARRIEALEVIDPARQPTERALFGATVTVRDDEERERNYRLVGVDEAAPSRGDVSWQSPIARALLGAEVGDVVTVKSPRGEEELEVLRVRYVTEARADETEVRADEPLTVRLRGEAGET
ncbi:GreA/GreB family elongation factor [Chondromyces crocatus]|uniref:Gramicidin S synthase n=1 Tax=Chondromyces crocatus TaxID=52 RepID=A0A0K1EJY4_CHOCO|nr:GreA/GreB family elongation factor [Chondromyces crocatus]AKT41159.1 gramicidin S synthase [Chondromyces crocatus]